MSRSPGKSRSRLHSHTHSAVRAPSLSARALWTAVFVLAGAPVLPLLSISLFGGDASLGRIASAQDAASAPARAADETNPSDETSKAPSIADAVRGLGDPSFAERERSSRALLGHGEAALPALRAALTSEDAEVRHRAEALIDQIVRGASSPEAVDPARVEPDRASPLARLPFSEEDFLRGFGGEQFDETIRRLDEMFRDLDRVTPPATERFRIRMDQFDHDLDERIAELHDRVRRHFERFPGGSIDERIFGGERLFGPDGSGRGDAARSGSGSARVQIWRDGVPVLDSARTYDFTEIASLGIAVESVHPSLRAHLPIPAGEGLTVGHVSPDTPAAAAGLKEYDVLLQVDGTPVTNVAALRAQVTGNAREALRFTILRAGASLDVEVTLPRTRR